MTGNRYAKDIRRIVGIDPNQGALDDAVKKESISGKRGIAYRLPGARTSGAVSGTAATSSLTDVSSLDTPVGPISQGSSSVQPYELAGNIQSTTDGAVTGKQLIDGTVEQSKLNSPQQTEEGLKYENAAPLLNLTDITDCESGTELDLLLRNDLDFPPPSSWTGISIGLSNATPDSPPFMWTKGIWYRILNPNNGNSFGALPDADRLTPYETATNIEKLFGAGAFTGPAADAIISIEAGSVNGYGDFVVSFDPAKTNPVISNLYGTQFPIAGSSCGTPESGSAGCPLFYDPFPNAMWASDSKAQLKFSNGQFVSSKWDPDRLTKYIISTSRVDFCFEGGTRFGVIEATRNNGYMIYETATEGGAPTGIVRVYDSRGTLVSATDASAESLAVFRP